MLNKRKLLVFPTSRSIRTYLLDYKNGNFLLPHILTIDEFFKKSININEKKYCDEEQRIIFLNQSIKNVNVEKLGISSSFTNFLKQSEYIYRFLVELSSEKVSIDEISLIDTYDFYSEHLEILKQIKKNYENLLDENGFVDRINLNNNYNLNMNFLDKIEDIEIVFEGYFTNLEFDIIDEISKLKNMNISFISNIYNSKSIMKFQKFFDYEFKVDYKYKINLTRKEILEEEYNQKRLKNLKIEAFSSRINQIAFIKNSIVDSVNNGVEPSKIALILPDETFANDIQLFDSENYFNYAMGKPIKNFNLYQVANAINLYINNKEIKDIKNLEFLNIQKEFLDKNIKVLWNKTLTLENFQFITEYIKSFENDEELLEKYDEIVYKLKILLFSLEYKILCKNAYKIFLQRISKITIDDVNSGKITVLGLLETRAVNFDTIIICDFNEEFIPKKSVKDKFLSTKIKQKSNLPTSLNREALQKYYYKRLIDSSENIFISFVHNESSQISRFAYELFNIKIDDATNDKIYSHILYNNYNLNHIENEIIEKIDLTKFQWSASSLKIFLQCRRKFYLQYILKIKEHTISLKPKNFELGEIIHSILEEYYKSASFEYSKIEELFLKYKSDNPFLILELEIWKKKLKDFYEYEKYRLKNRKIIALEQDFNLKFEEFSLKGVIDRVDIFEDKYEVIDYKTSNNLKVDTSRTFENSDDFQLEFYYLAIKELYKSDKIDCFYYDLSNTKLIKEELLENKLQLLSKKFEEISDLSKDKISFYKCEDNSICQYCHYKIICNKD